MRNGRVLVAWVLAVALASCEGTGPTTSPPHSTTTATTAASPITAVTTTTAPPPPPTTPAAPTSTAATTPTTTIVPLPEPLGGWERIPVDPAVFGDVTLTDGAAGGGRFVLGGCPVAQPPAGPFPLWWSDDGESWQRAGGPPGEACIVQVEATPFGFLADDRHGRFYRSADGIAWDTLAETDLGFAEGSLGVVLAIFVAPAGDRVTLLYSRASLGESREATLVTTTDGATWELVADPVQLFGNSP